MCDFSPIDLVLIALLESLSNQLRTSGYVKKKSWPENPIDFLSNCLHSYLGSKSWKYPGDIQPFYATRSEAAEAVATCCPLVNSNKKGGLKVGTSHEQWKDLGWLFDIGIILPQFYGDYNKLL